MAYQKELWRSLKDSNLRACSARGLHIAQDYAPTLRASLYRAANVPTNAGGRRG